MRDNSSASDTQESQSRLWVAVALSMTMIFTSYAVSVLNHQTDVEVNAQTYSPRPVVVGYLA
jgi:hypothetical protein